MVDVKPDVSAASAKHISKGMKWVIFPDNKMIKCWDMIVFLLVLYYLVVIPYQMGISASYYIIKYIWWFGVNVVFDFIFFIDTFLYFFRAYHDEDGRLIFRLETIRRHYLKGRFWVNLISLIPSNGVLFRYGHAPINGAEGTNWYIENAGFITLIKVFDLLKLIRVTRILFLLRESTWLMNLRQSLNSQLQAMFYYSFFLMLVAHWFACIWGLCVFLETEDWSENLLDKPNWISAWYDGNYIEGGLNPIGYENDLQRYVLCIFWSIQTITSIGYGNIAPVTFTEWWISSLLMIFSGFWWAYLIGGLVNIASALHEKSDNYGKMNDEANAMIAKFSETQLVEVSDKYSYQALTAYRIKKYILDQSIKSKSTGHSKHFEDIFPVYATLSPYLKSMSSLMLVKDDLEVVPYLSSKYLSIEQQAAVALECVCLEFGAGEICDTQRYVEEDDIGRGIFVIKSGSALAFDYYDDNKFNSRLLSSGTELGMKKVLVEDGHPRARARLKFLSFSRVTFIPRSAIFKSFKRNPRSWKDCGRWKYALAMILSKYARGKKNLFTDRKNSDGPLEDVNALPIEETETEESRAFAAFMIESH